VGWIMRRLGGHMRAAQKGFTLIELLIVVVIIGVLAAIAIPKFVNTKERAMVANMKSDLRNMVTAQEGYFSTNFTYYNGPVPSATLTFQPSEGVALALSAVTTSGWAATATHAATARVCYIFYGTGGPNGPATIEGRVECS
jgi:prepilin-type N-terminal cleavage/methylation domain-containing protein